MVNPIKSHGKPIFLWFSYGFPMVFVINQMLKKEKTHGNWCLRSGPAVSSAFDNVALSLGDVIDAATQD